MLERIPREYGQEDIARMISKNKTVLILRKEDNNYVYVEAIGYHTGYHSWGGHEAGQPWEWTYHHMHLSEYNSGKSFWDMPDDTARPSEIFRFNEDLSMDDRIELWNSYLRDQEHWCLEDYSDFESEESSSKEGMCRYLKYQMNNAHTIDMFITDGNSHKNISVSAKAIIKEFLLNHKGYYAETFGLKD